MSAKLAKSMLGFADDFIEGATKGIGAGSGIKVGVNRRGFIFRRGRLAVHQVLVAVFLNDGQLSCL